MSSTAPSEQTKSKEKYFFFYGHNDKDGPKACFSNWYPAEFKDKEGRRFGNSEQYMMWRKAVLMKDDTMAAKILKESDPRKVKGLGRAVENFDADLWNKNARAAVRDGCYLKFSQNKEMATALLKTGSQILVEASPSDKIWGIGFSAAEALSVPKSQWGTNWLGEVLMEVRELLRKDATKDNTAAVDSSNSTSE